MLPTVSESQGQSWRGQGGPLRGVRETKRGLSVLAMKPYFFTKLNTGKTEFILFVLKKEVKSMKTVLL